MCVDGDHHFFFGDQVLERQLGFFLHDLRATLVLILVFDLGQFIADDLAHQRLAAQDRPQIFNLLQYLAILLDQLIALQLGEPLQAHLQNGVRLQFRQLKLLHQAGAGDIRRLRAPDEGDDGIQIIQRDLEAFKDMGALFRLAKIIRRPPHDDLAPMLNEGDENPLEVQHFRPIVDERQHVHAERGLQLTMFVEVVQDHEGNLIPFQLDHHANALAIGLVADIGDARHAIFLRQIGDLLDQLRLVHLIGNLRDDESFPVGAFIRLDGDLSADGQ